MSISIKYLSLTIILLTSISTNCMNDSISYFKIMDPTISEKIMATLIESGDHQSAKNLSLANKDFHDTLWKNVKLTKLFLKGLNTNKETFYPNYKESFFDRPNKLYPSEYEENFGLKLTRCLINAGADVNECDNESQTALHLAIKNGNLEMARILMKAGADVNLQNKKGQTSLHLYIELLVTNLNKSLKR